MFYHFMTSGITLLFMYLCNHSGIPGNIFKTQENGDTLIVGCLSIALQDTKARRVDTRDYMWHNKI